MHQVPPSAPYWELNALISSYSHLLNHDRSPRGSLSCDCDQQKWEGTNSPRLSPTSSPHLLVACQILSPFMRSCACLTPYWIRSNSYV